MRRVCAAVIKVTALLLVSVLTVIACGAPAPAAQAPAGAPQKPAAPAQPVAAQPAAVEKIPLKITFGSAISGLMWPVAEELKLFEKHGLAIEVVKAEGGAEINEGFASGRIEAGANGTLPAVTAWTRGLAHRPAVVQAQGGDRYTILATKKSGITSIKDLKGKKVAVQKGTDPEAAFYAALKANGLDYRDIQAIDAKWADHATLLARGEVDASNNNEPFSSTVLSRMADQVVPIERLGKYYQAATNTVVSDAWASRYPDGPRRLALVVWEGQDWIRKNPDRAAEIGAKFYRQKPEDVRAALKDFVFDPRVSDAILRDFELSFELLVSQGKATADKKPDFAAKLKSAREIQQQLAQEYAFLLPK